MISFTVTVKLIGTFVFPYADCWFSHEVAHIFFQEWNARAEVPNHVIKMLNNFPAKLHPMSQFSAAITAMNTESKFAKAYHDGVKKTSYWEVGIHEPQRKTGLRGFRPGLLQTDLYSHRRWLEASNGRGIVTICVAENKGTVQLLGLHWQKSGFLTMLLT